MKWRIANCMRDSPKLEYKRVSPCLDHHGSADRRRLTVRLMHLYGMVDREDRQSEPNRRCRGRADFQHRNSDDSNGQHDLKINHVTAGKFDLSIAFLEKIHNGSRTMRILREKI